MRKIYLLLLLSFFISTLSFAQTSKPSVINFTEVANHEKLHPVTPEKKIGNRETEDDEVELPLKMKMPANAKRMYQAPELKQRNPLQTTVVSPSPTNNFLALTDNNSTIPPDVHGAVGTNHLMVALNSEFKITDKTGAQISKVSAVSFWNGVTPGGLSDPHILFDHYTNRWIMVGQSTLDANSSVLVAVSQTEDPTGNWNRYALKVDPTSLSGFDYPLVGFNQNWLVIAGNIFTIATSANNGSQIYVLDMANLNAGGAITLGTTTGQRISNTNASGFSLSPSTVFETGAPTNPMYIVQNWNGGSAAIRLTSLTGTLPAVTWNEGAATFPTAATPWASSAGVSNNNSSPQLTEARKINSGDARICNTIVVNGKIWTAHHVFFPSVSPTRAAIQWWQLQTNGAILQNGLIDDGVSTVHRTYPSIAVNDNEDVLIGYSKFTTSSYPSAAYSFRTSATPVNTLQDEVVYKTGVATYWKDFGGGRARWGDYSNTCLDPVSKRLWTIQEYAEARATPGTADNDSRWSTWWAEVAPAAASSSVFFVNSGLVTTETGTTGTCPRYKDIDIPVGINGAATGNATLNVTTSGSAISGLHYSILTPTLTYVNGDNAQKNVTVRIYDNPSVEGSRTITLGYTISGAGVIPATSGQITNITITDDDKFPVASTTLNTTFGTASINVVTGGVFNGSAYTDKRVQNLYLASELTAAGFSAGSITDFAWFFNSGTVATFNNLNVTIGSTAAASVSSGFVALTSSATVYSGNYTTGTTGWVNFPLATPFVWDGTSNIIVEACFDNTAITSDVFLLGSTPAFTPSVLVRQNAAGTVCSAAAANLGGSRPDIKIGMTMAGAQVATTLSSTITGELGPNEEVPFYDASGKILARIKNLTSFDYGCTTIQIDRAGTSSSQFWNNTPANYLLNKSYKVIPTNNTTTGSYEITLYYTQAEVNGWQTATGQTFANAQMAKVSNGHYIPDVSPATPYASDVIVTSATSGAYGTDYTIKSTFTNTGFSGFGVGIPAAAPVPVTLINFTALDKNGFGLLTWSTENELNNKGFDIEKSYDGVTFFKIGFAAGAGNSSLHRNYVFPDPARLTSVQYFRLKQTDLNGKSTYSNIAVLKRAGRLPLDVISITNPFRDNVSIVFTENPQSQVKFELLDAAGQRIFTGSQMINSVNAQLQIPSSIAAGNYLLKIFVNNQSFSKKLIKQ